MPETVRARTALDPARLVPRGIRLGERREIGKIDLRGDPHDRAFMAAVGRVLDLLLPTEPCTSARKQGIAALWLGPDEWLLTCPADDVPRLVGYVIAVLAALVLVWRYLLRR